MILKKLKSKNGQGLPEYAITVLAIIGIMIVVLFETENPLTEAIQTAFSNTAAVMEGAGS